MMAMHHRTSCFAIGAVLGFPPPCVACLASHDYRCVYPPPQSKDKGVRPEELVQQYDALVALAHDMGELAGEVGGADAEHLMDEAAAAEARFMASRALFLGVAALAGGRAEEAVALLELAAQRGLDGLGKTQVGGWLHDGLRNNGGLLEPQLHGVLERHM